MPDQDGFEIYNRFYPAPSRFRMGDPVLVKEVTGLTWPEFTAALDAMEKEYASLSEQGRADEFEADHALMLGLMSVAFWQGNPTMGRAKVVRAIERIPIEEVEFVAADEGDVSPPAVAEAGSTQSPTSSESDASPEAQAETETPPAATLEETTPNGSGSPGSLNLHPESLPA